MASSSGKDFEIDDGQQEHTAPVGASECTGRDRGKKESGVSDEVLTGRDSWSLFRFFGRCCSGAPSSKPSMPSPSPSSEPRMPSPSPSSSWTYHSPRIQRMMEKERGEFSTEVECEIEASKSHWSQVDASVAESEQSAERNRKYLEVLRRRKYVYDGDQLVAKDDERMFTSLFEDGWGDDLVVGEKLAEGGQAEIYAASHPWDPHPLVVKVFKAGSVLQDLEKQWPPALLKFHQWDYERYDPDRSISPLNGISGATLLRDERLLDRFAFVMERRWGDLRTLIDQRMMQSHNQGPPLTCHQVLSLILQIANGMKALHGQHPPILHKGLKAANVLVWKDVWKDDAIDGPYLTEQGNYIVNVADYECSVGVVGTGLWRAPEILQQLKDKVPMCDLKFTKECDVYSYGMLCYELVTGRIPFEDYDRIYESRDMVLKGERLELPHDLDPRVKAIIITCWDSSPLRRPSFEDIYGRLDKHRGLK